MSDDGPEVVAGARLVLLRHGRTAWNADGRFQGQLDPPLDDTGRHQAAAAAPAVLALSPSLVLSSDLQRAASTAQALCDAGGPVPAHHAGLREIHLGGWQGLTREEIKDRFGEEYRAWTAGEDVRRGGGETYAEVAERALAVCRPALESRSGTDGPVVAVTHGGTARAVIGALLGLEPEHWWRFGPLGNCRWSALLKTQRGWRLTGHDVGAADPLAARR